MDDKYLKNIELRLKLDHIPDTEIQHLINYIRQLKEENSFLKTELESQQAPRAKNSNQVDLFYFKPDLFCYSVVVPSFVIDNLAKVSFNNTNLILEKDYTIEKIKSNEYEVDFSNCLKFIYNNTYNHDDTGDDYIILEYTRG